MPTVPTPIAPTERKASVAAGSLDLGVDPAAFADPLPWHACPDGSVHTDPLCLDAEGSAPADLPLLEVTRICIHCTGTSVRVAEEILAVGRLLGQVRPALAVPGNGPGSSAGAARAGALRDLRFQICDSIRPLAHVPRLRAAGRASAARLAAAVASVDVTALATDPVRWSLAAAAATAEPDPGTLLGEATRSALAALHATHDLPQGDFGRRRLRSVYAAVVDELLAGGDWSSARPVAVVASVRAAGTQRVPAVAHQRAVGALLPAWRVALEGRLAALTVPDPIGGLPDDLAANVAAGTWVVTMVWLGHHRAGVDLPGRSRSRIHEILAPAPIRTDLEDGGAGVLVLPAAVAALLVTGQLPGSYTAEVAGPASPEDTAETLRVTAQLRNGGDLSVADALTAARGILRAPGT